MNEKALSPLVGLALILASAVSVIAIYQTQTVPSILKEQEFDHYLLVKSEFETLAEKLARASERGSFVVVSFPLQVKYESFSFAPLPPAEVSIVVEKVGYVNVSYGNSEFSFDLVALKLSPNYRYLKAGEEVLVLGRYFTSNGNLLEKVDPIVVLNVSSKGGKLKLESTQLNLGREMEVEVKVLKSEYSWLLSSLADEFGGEISGNSVKFKASSIVIASAKAEPKEKMTSERLKAEDMAFNVSVSENENVEIEIDDGNLLRDGGELEVEFEDSSVSSVMIYISGYTSYFSENVSVSITYCEEEDDGVCEEELMSQVFYWNTLSNGVLQLPIEVLREAGDEEDYVMLVSLRFPGEEVFKFTIDVSEEEED